MSALDLAALLAALDEADRALRARYAALAEDPDRDDGEDLERLRQRRLELARQVGLAALEAHRARSVAEVAPNAQVGQVAETAEVAQTAEATTGAETEEPAETEVVPEPDTPAEPDHAAAPPPAAPDSALRPTAISPPPASVDAIRAFTQAARAQGLSTGASLAAVASTPTWWATLSELLDGVGAPRALDDPSQVRAEIDALERIGGAGPRARWAQLPRSLQQPWLSMLVARARAAREHVERDERTRLRTLMLAYPEFAAEHRPGHVNGLKLTHGPLGVSWSADARGHWATLVAELDDGAPTAAATAKGSRGKPARASKPDERDAESSGRAEEPTVSLPHLAARHQPVIIVGGEDDAQKLERIRRRTQIPVEWVGCAEGETIARRVREGHVAAVIVLDGLGGHSLLAPVLAATRRHDVPLEYAKRGGLASIVGALQAVDARMSTPPAA